MLNIMTTDTDYQFKVSNCFDNFNWFDVAFDSSP